MKLKTLLAECSPLPYSTRMHTDDMFIIQDAEGHYIAETPNIDEANAMIQMTNLAPLLVEWAEAYDRKDTAYGYIAACDKLRAAMEGE